MDFESPIGHIYYILYAHSAIQFQFNTDITWKSLTNITASLEPSCWLKGVHNRHWSDNTSLLLPCIVKFYINISIPWKSCLHNNISKNWVNIRSLCLHYPQPLIKVNDWYKWLLAGSALKTMGFPGDFSEMRATNFFLMEDGILSLDRNVNKH